MAQIGPMTIHDGQSTPVSHVFTPIKSVPPYYRRSASGVSAALQEEVLINARLTDKANGVNEIDLILTLPVAETVGPANSSGYVAPPAVAHRVRAKVTFYMHQRSTVDVRKDVRVLLSNLLKDAQIVDAIDNLAIPY